MRRLALAAGLALLVPACGGGASEESEPAPAAAAVETVSNAGEATLPGWMSSYLAEPGPEVALIPATTDHAVGENRVSFLVVRNDGSLVQSPTATVLFAPEGVTEPEVGEASLEPLGAHSHPDGTEAHDHVDATDLYVATLSLPEVGRYWLVVQPDDADIQAIGSLDVRRETVSPPVGSPAPRSDNPTIADAPAEQITTARPPDTELLRYSIADSIAEGKPFVAVFATPKFCETRACGPTVEIVDQVRRELGTADVRFIHVEVYQDNDPAKGVNPWFAEWRLPTEPWIFLVDGEGTIRAKYQGSASVDELREAVEQHLL